MILIQELKEIIREDFGIDQVISSFSATVTLLAFVLTFSALIINSLKEKREAKKRSEKTLNLLEFIFEYNNHKFESYLEKMKYIRKNADKESPEVIDYDEDHGNVEMWKGKNNQDPVRHFIINIEKLDMSFEHILVRNLPAFDGLTYLGTNYKKNYIVIQIFTLLQKKALDRKLNSYEYEIKANLKNQHLNITSDSLGKIYDRIQAIKKSRDIYKSIEINGLLEIAHYEKFYEEKEIIEILSKSPSEVIDKEHDKLVNLENELKKVIEPLNSGGVTWLQRCSARVQSAMKMLFRK